MSPTEIIREVARAFGEEIQVIQRLGFSVVEPDFIDPERDTQDPQVIDWDATDDGERLVSFFEVAV